MAFLGGLMSGTKGAFIRGSLDTATDIIQATAERDEESILEKVKGFGAKKTAYDAGVSEYAKQKKIITEVAQIVGAQNDDFLKDLSPSDLEGYAQSLISTSGAKNAGDAIKYFFENRDKLGIVDIPSVGSPSVSDTAEQTDSILSGSAQTEKPKTFMGALGRVFRGQSSAETDAAAAARMGISVEQYKRVMKGAVPQLPDPSVALILNKDNPLTKTITDSHTSILSIFRKDGDNALITPDTVIKLSDGTELKGDEISAKYMSSYKAFLKDNNANVDTMYELQSAIVTTSIPDTKVRQYIQSFDDELEDFRNTIFNLDLSSDVRKPLNKIYTDAIDMKRKIALNPEFANDMNVATQYEDVIKQGLALMTGIEKPSDGTLKMPDVFINVNKQLERYEAIFADPAKKEFMDDNDIEAMRQARILINSAATNVEGIDLIDALAIIQEKVNEISISEKDPAANGTEFERSVAYNMKLLKDAGFDGTTDEARKIAEHHASGDSKIGSTFQDKGFTMMVTLDSQGNVITVPVRHKMTVGGKETAPPPVVADANESIDNTLASFRAIGRLNVAVRSVASGLGILGLQGEARIYATDFADFFGMRGVAEGLKGAEAEQARRDAISFLTAAKDELFKDPRLSDKDLAMVTDYVGLLNQPTIGFTRSVSALNGLTRIFATTQAIAYADKFIDTPAIEFKGDFDPLNPTEIMDISKESISTMVLTNLLETNRIPGGSNPAAKIKELKKFDEENGTNKTQQYIQVIAPYVDIAHNAGMAVMARRRSPEGYKRNFKTAGLPSAN
jgi:hypothetical protein